MKKRLLCAFLAMLLLLCACLVSCERDNGQKDNTDADTSATQNKTPTQQTFVPPAFEANAVAGEHGLKEGERGYGVLDARGTYRVGVCGQVAVAEGNAYVWFTNPAENNVWLKLRVLDGQTGAILGETGLLKPGEYVTSVSLAKTPAKGSPIVLRVMSYEPQTYYSKGEISLNTTIS